jgi:hypothetical protein
MSWEQFIPFAIIFTFLIFIFNKLDRIQNAQDEILTKLKYGKDK